MPTGASRALAALRAGPQSPTLLMESRSHDDPAQDTTPNHDLGHALWPPGRGAAYRPCGELTWEGCRVAAWWRLGWLP